MRRRMRDESGTAFVTALLVIAAMMVLGMALMVTADTARNESAAERFRETAFNVAEGALAGQTWQLGRNWPRNAAMMPTSCTRTSTATACPPAASLEADFAGTAFTGESGWNVEVRDNLGTTSTYYSQAVLQATPCAGILPCTWDSNRDGMLWVRASGTVGGRVRTLVSLVRRQTARIPLPRNVITAHRLRTNNNGRKTIIDGKGCSAKVRPVDSCNSTQPAPVVVRCTTSTPATTNDACLGYRAEQLYPNLYQMGSTGNVLQDQQVDQVRQLALQNGTYHTSCPSSSALAGPVVFIDGVSCSYTVGSVNSAAAPGILVVNRGTLSLGGEFNFFGVIIAVNGLAPPADAGDLVSLTGTAYVQGAVIVEGNGGVLTGASGLNVSFDETALGNLSGLTGVVERVPNSFRELPRGR